MIHALMAHASSGLGCAIGISLAILSAVMACKIFCPNDDKYGNYIYGRSDRK